MDEAARQRKHERANARALAKARVDAEDSDEDMQDPSDRILASGAEEDGTELYHVGGRKRGRGGGGAVNTKKNLEKARKGWLSLFVSKKKGL